MNAPLHFGRTLCLGLLLIKHHQFRVRCPASLEALSSLDFTMEKDIVLVTVPRQLGNAELSSLWQRLPCCRIVPNAPSQMTLDAVGGAHSLDS